MRASRLAPLFVALAVPSCMTIGDFQLESTGFDAQAYPTGVITTAKVDWSADGERELSVYAGWNEADRSDNGQHDDETGGGPGLGIGYRQYFGDQRDTWFLGGRVDVWQLGIDWVDRPGSPTERSGDTDITILQPTLVAGYRLLLGDSDWALDFSAALGAEINVITSGSQVGQGAIGLVGIGLTYSL